MSANHIRQTKTASALLLFVLSILSGCGGPKPTNEDFKKAIATYYSDPDQQKLPVEIVRVGEQGKGDFSAPGSQDTFWPVQFRRSAETQIGAITLKEGQNGTAQIYRSKMGEWKVATMQEEKP